MKFISPLGNKIAQSITEIIVVVALVAASIIIMGPYVIRSWNANIKGWDDSVQDSMTDPLGQTPPGILIPDCICDFKAPCDDPPCCGFDTCSIIERSLVWLCDPLNCAPEPIPPPPGINKCQADINCCGEWVKRQVPENCGETGCPETKVPADRVCAPGSSLPTFTCLDDPDCLTQCNQGAPAPTGPQYLGICEDDNVGLHTDTNWTTVAERNCSTPEGSIPKCEIECHLPYLPTVSNTQCACKEGTREWLNPCYVGHCQQGSCSDGECEFFFD